MQLQWASFQTTAVPTPCIRRSAAIFSGHTGICGKAGFQIHAAAPRVTSITKPPSCASHAKLVHSPNAAPKTAFHVALFARRVARLKVVPMNVERAFRACTFTCQVKRLASNVLLALSQMFLEAWHVGAAGSIS